MQFWCLSVVTYIYIWTSSHCQRLRYLYLFRDLFLQYIYIYIPAIYIYIYIPAIYISIWTSPHCQSLRYLYLLRDLFLQYIYIYLNFATFPKASLFVFISWFIPAIYIYKYIPAIYIYIYIYIYICIYLNFTFPKASFFCIYFVIYSCNIYIYK